MADRGAPARTRWAQFGACLLLCLWSLTARADGTRMALQTRQFRLVESESGPNNYYAFVDDKGPPFIRADYRPGFKSAVLGYQVPDALRSQVHTVEWSWRALTLPKDPSACDAESGIADSPALVYVIWKRGLRWYTLRYAWSSRAAIGSVCDRKRNPFVAQDTVVLETGSSNGAWMNERIDIKAAFRRHFADGDPTASVPDLVGVGLMTDGDQTKSASAADYAGFVLVY
jgi:hypothetical protein